MAARLGEGGQGVVYLGRAAAGGPVAVKVLRAELSDDVRARRRFFRELRAARRVDSSYTARIVDVVFGDDVSFIVTAYVAGPSLRDAVRQDGPISGDRLERVAIAMATALAAIHRAGVVHRDFKPGNVLLGPDGPRVIDFGIARLLDTSGSSNSLMMGTPPFMAPEQFRGEQVGTAADVFAWGCTVAYAANGRPPFDSDDLPAIINRILNDDPDLGDLDGVLREVVAACLHKSPRRRPTADQLVGWLLGEETARPSPPVPMSDPSRRARVGLDVTKPNVARIYDYWLGGKDNFAADREAAEKLLAIVPEARLAAQVNRAFLGRVVLFLTAAGIRQFIDLGTGLPTQASVHEVARPAVPAARVVYVDNDPVVRVHAEALLGGIDTATVIEADLRDPDKILAHPDLDALIDFDEPVALLMLAVVQFVTDAEGAQDVVARFREAVPPGSYLVISHVTADPRPQAAAPVSAVYNRATAPLIPRSRTQVRRFFDGLDIVEPGVVYAPQWHPDSLPDITVDPKNSFMLVGVGHKS